MRRMTPISRNSARMSPATPLSHYYAQLEPDMLMPRHINTCASPKRKRGNTPLKQCFHQTVDTTVDDTTKQKLKSLLGKNPSDEQ